MNRPLERGRGLWRTEIVRAVLSGHSILGIAFAAAIYIVCLTGTLCVFQHDWQRWEQPRAPSVRSIDDRAIERAVVAMGKRVGPTQSFFVTLPDADFARFTLATGGDADDERLIADGAGNLAARQLSPWADFLTALHTNLLTQSTWGGFIVGLTGVALLSSLISGILAHPRVFRDAFHLRLGGSRRLEQADLHNRLGVWPLPFHVVVSLTGALLGLSTLIVGMLATLLFRGDTQQVYHLLYTPPPAVDARPAPMPDVATLLVAARVAAPGTVPHQITVQHWGRRDMRLTVASGRSRLIGMQDEVTFDPAGHVVAAKHPRDQNVGTAILGALGPLHFGWFGGLAVRIVYGVLGLTLCIVTVSGITVWLARRRDKGRPAPTLERLWAGVAWGQPVVLAGIALAARSASSPPPTSLALGWAIGSLLIPALAAAASGMSRGRIVFACRVMAAALLVSLAAMGLGDAGPHEVSRGIINALLLAGAIIFSSPMWHRSGWSRGD